MEKFDIFDTDILGKKDANGNVSQYYGKDALTSSLTNWLTSFQGDVIRAPNRAGYLTRYLYKPMSDTNKRNMVEAIIDGIHQDYYPTVKIDTIEIFPDYENKTWEINLSVYSYLLKENTDVSLKLKNLI